MNKFIEDSDIAIEVSGLWKIFGENAGEILNSPEKRAAAKEALLEETGCVVAVRDVSFRVQRGEIFVIMGSSDSGKSTLIRMIIRLIEATKGKIIIDGEDVTSFNDRRLMTLRRKTTGMIFHHFGLLPHRSVLDNVAYGLKVRGVDKATRYAKAREVIDKVRLKGWENQYPGALSGGMQQRVGIARALANDPKILLMDEPFTGLDTLVMRQMQDELLTIQEEVHKTILFATHDLDEALKLGDHIAIMKDGAIIQVGTPEEVITTPGDEYVRTFVQDASPTKIVTARSIVEHPKALVYEWQGPKAAMHLLRSNQLEEAFIVSRNGKLMGLVTISRLIDLFRQKETSLQTALEPDFHTTVEDTVMEDLFPLAASTIYPIAVVDDKGKFLGQISTATIMVSMIRQTAERTAETEAKETAGAVEEKQGE
ncbi:glycine betaine/L-proline ABC transporter ATP-binding protein [Chloroflexota bacterium]